MAKKDYSGLTKSILESVGGKENINSVFHCVTRLRFKLKDESIAKTDEIKNLEGVVTVMQSGGQYQVVIGNHVPDVYTTFLEVANISAASSDDGGSNKNVGLGARFIDMISGVFTPILGVLAATGMIKGFSALILALHWVTATSGTYNLLNMAGDGFFNFLPIFLGYTAMKKFGGTPFIGMAIAAALTHPGLTALSAGKPLYTLFKGSLFQSDVHITFLGIPVILMSYASSVIPILVSAYFATKVEKGFKKIIPDVVKAFIVPFLTIIVMVPLTFLVIGPISTWAGSLLGAATIWLYHLSPIVAGLLIGGFWQVFVIFGLHWGLVPIAINNLSTLHYDPVLATTVAVCFAQIGAVLAVMLKTKNKGLKSLTIPAFISGIFGVTEPAIYGVTLPLKKPFIMSCIGGAVSGGIIAATAGKLWMFGDDADDLWILGDSTTRIKHNKIFVYESLLSNKLGLEIIRLLEEISLEHTIIACTRSGAVIKNSISSEEAAIVRRSYAQVRQVSDFNEITEDFVKITIHDPFFILILNCFFQKTTGTECVLLLPLFLDGVSFSIR